MMDSLKQRFCQTNALPWEVNGGHGRFDCGLLVTVQKARNPKCTQIGIMSPSLPLFHLLQCPALSSSRLFVFGLVRSTPSCCCFSSTRITKMRHFQVRADFATTTVMRTPPQDSRSCSLSLLGQTHRPLSGTRKTASLFPGGRASPSLRCWK